MRSKGSNSPPKAKMVTPLPPVKAVKNEHSTVAANKVPSKPLPKMAKNKTPRRCTAPVLANNRPARVNKGKAGNDGLTVIWYCDKAMEANG